MRRAMLFTLATAFAGAASAEVRSSTSYSVQKEVLSGGGGSTSSAGLNAFSSFAQPQTGLVQSPAGRTAQLGFLCGGGAPPAPPQNLTAEPGDGQVRLDWDDNAEPNLAGYNVYRSENPGGPYSRVSETTVTQSGYTDTGLTNGTTYHYVVRALDEAFRESTNSNEASAKPLGLGVLGGGCGTGVAPLVLGLALLTVVHKRRKPLGEVKESWAR